ncbi:hypothetical protein F383_37252 [Gossypium arboreum]|uniref:Uncharacterized protein n=1 Tax=Gossypium arboreum TaxID=29729 RepID=A0A0B0MBJ6_GOSAR|nr:hypothetical protein F383_37252 [Gossypium arboreum]
MDLARMGNLTRV